MSTADDRAMTLLDQALRALTEYELATGDGNARHAQHVLLGSRKAGAKPKDDAALLAEVAELVQQQRATNAVAIVARRHARTLPVIRAIEHRLRRKLRQQKNRH
jgi:hypothetical protein